MFKTLLREIGIRALKYAGVHPRDPALSALLGYGDDAASGVNVTHQTALTYSAVWAAIRINAETMGSLPHLTYQKTTSGKKEAEEHPVYSLLSLEPNPEMTACVFHETMQAHIEARGNCYAEIEWSNGGQPLNLWPLPPDSVDVIRRPDGKGLGYIVHNANMDATPIAAENIIHIPGLGYDGVKGYNVIQLARESIGVGIATEKYGAKFYANSARPSGILTTAGRLKETTKKTMRRTWEEAHKGLDKAHRIAVLDGGLTWQAMSFSPADAEFLANRKFNLSEIARWFNVPNHLLRDLDNSTNNNIEHQGIEYVIYSLRSKGTRWNQEARRKLFTKAERKTFYTAFSFNGLTAGDRLTRYQSHQIALLNGFKNIDEVREEEDDNKLPNGDGQKYRVPVNTQPVDEPPPAAPGNVDDKKPNTSAGGPGGVQNG
jgi:HK97 family phage portal protein